MKVIFGACLIYTLSFIAWRHLQPGGIVFYQGVFLALVTACVQLGYVMWSRVASRNMAIKDALLTFLLLYSAVFTVPTTVDRAYSVRMILQIENDPEGLTRDQIERWFATDFGAQGGVEKRLQEQLATGSISNHEGRYKLTPFGVALANSFRVIQTLFATKPFEQDLTR